MQTRDASFYPGPAESPVTERQMIHPVKLGVYLFFASEAIFFVFLIFAYVYYRSQVNTGATAKTALDVGRTGIYTAILLASSGTVIIGERAIVHGRELTGRIWLALTIVLGAVFLVGQGLEYNNLINQEITLNSNLFGTTFFTLTGFHGLHVFAGLIMLCILLALAIQGEFKNGKHKVAVEVISLYWHFVDVVWVVVFSVVYLWTLIS